MSQEIIMCAVFHAKPEYVGELRDRLKEMVHFSREESGCLFYDLHVDRTDESFFTFLESWESQEALDRHDQTAHVKAIIADSQRLTVDGIHVKFMHRVLLRSEIG